VTFDLGQHVSRWRTRRRTFGGVALALLALMAILIAAGGPPNPLTHLFYLPVIVAAVLWGPRWGIAAGALAGALAGPVPSALLGDAQTDGWMLRAFALAVVGWVCGSLTRSLLQRVQELETLNRDTIFAFVRAIDARDPYTALHSEKVAAYAVQLARALGLAERDCERIRLAGLLHDVGKVALERSVLHKPGRLSEEEWAAVREHPALSAHIIGGVTSFAAFVPGARHHHERYDGQGYPDRLAGEAIPLDARILAVADAYDAMTSDRSYRTALSHAEAIGRLEAGSGTQFDPVCVRAFAALEPDSASADDALVPILRLDPVTAA
jgi:hypothetical protein